MNDDRGRRNDYWKWLQFVATSWQIEQIIYHTSMENNTLSEKGGGRGRMCLLFYYFSLQFIVQRQGINVVMFPCHGGKETLGQPVLVYYCYYWYFFLYYYDDCLQKGGHRLQDIYLSFSIWFYQEEGIPSIAVNVVVVFMFCCSENSTELKREMHSCK